jgi:glycosyltransferase involved in cell wall biosynthesis
LKATLLILTPGFPKDEADTTCLPPQQVFVKAVREMYPGLDILVLSFQYPFEKKIYYWHGIPVMSFGGKNKGGFSRILLWQRIRRELKDIHSQKRIIGVISFMCGECALVGKKFAVKNYLKHYSWILGQDAKKINIYVKYIKPQASELIALSDFIAEEFERNHKIRPAHIIPPGVEARLFHDKKVIKDIDILAAGSLIPLKQYHIFLEVVAAIKKTKPGIKVQLAGDGPERQKLQDLIVSLGLEDTVILTGELPHHEVLELMQRARIFLHPSSYEGFGVVCIEALYAGARVISFCKPMDKEITNWHIVRDKEEMIKATLALLDLPDSDEEILFAVQSTAERFMKLFEFEY